ncbi:MAG TPA: 16S rRNA (cytosine(967)-C(5))-methyltransferase RsmB [Gemmataceae bacterium]|nr:16S rRNA (cytosine(967)-C(5))-methyltransferase RsmB [Gemmataceae bacterium]
MTARHVALEVLLACRRHDAFVQEILNQQLAKSSIAGPDRRLASQLAYGVLRRRATLDALLNPFIERPLGGGKEAIQETLRLGVFQLAFLSRIPAHAAVHATVELVGAGMKRFVNGVLRNVDRLLTPDIVEQPAQDALPLESGRYRRLAKAVLPSPADNPVSYLAAGFALPTWLVARWLPRFGWEECLRLGFWFAATPPLWLRCNTLRTDRPTLLAALGAAGIEAEPGEHPQAIRLAEHGQVRELPGYDEGWFAVQDESAMNIASALAPKPGDYVLDLCAAPGSKTTHLAELMQNQGRIVACDIDDGRLQTLRELANRLGVTIIETRRLESSENPVLPAGPFDAILVDAPCSNTGVLGRRPEARWRLHETDLTDLAKLQTKLLHQAVNRLKPGGKLVYSTCSIEPQENQEIVRSVMQAMAWLALTDEAERRPGNAADGGYWARLSRF